MSGFNPFPGGSLYENLRSVGMDPTAPDLAAPPAMAAPRKDTSTLPGRLPGGFEPRPVSKPEDSPYAKFGSYMRNGEAYYIGTNKRLSPEDLKRVRAGGGVRTFRGPDGKFRWVGSGRLVHPSTLRAIQARRPGGGAAQGGGPAAAAGGGQRPRPLSLLDRQVNSAIAQQVTPLNQMLSQREQQYVQEQAANAAANRALQQELSGIASAGSERASQAILDAAGTQAAQEATGAATSDFLESVFGPNSTGNLDEFQAQNAALAASGNRLDNATVAGALGLGNQADQAAMSGIAGSSAQGSAEFGRELTNRRGVDTRNIQAQIAAIRASRPFLRRQFASQNRAERLAQQQLELERLSFLESQRQFDASLEAQQQQYQDELGAATAAANAEAEDEQRSGAYGLPPETAQRVDGVLDAVASLGQQINAGTPGARWQFGSGFNDGFQMLVSRATVTPDQAARIISRVYPPRAGTQTAVYNFLKRKRVSNRTIKDVLDRRFGEGTYARIIRGGGVSGSVSSNAGDIFGSIIGAFGGGGGNSGGGSSGGSSSGISGGSGGAW